ncbi:MAG: alpha/beta hydrolase [Thermodesulfobacteriota bacterium]|nr:alpha/beta hydrolase [Thermodesulfobacteriota bacterium]
MNQHPKEKYIRINGLRLHYLESGAKSSRPMILLHGTTDNAHVWDYIRAEVSAGFRVIALDQRGHGESDRPRPPAYKCEDYVSDLSELVKALELDGFVLMGHSMGALHAARYTSLNPDKVAGLIYVDIEPRPPDWNREYLHKRCHTLPGFYDSVQDFVDRNRGTNPFSQDEILFYLAGFALEERDDGKFYPKFDKEVLGRFDRYDVREGLVRISCPTLIIRGERSVVMRRKAAEEMNQAVSGSRFVEIPLATHPAHTDNPTRFQREVMNFLKETRLIDN